MISNLQDAKTDSTTVESDVCVIGSGAAGITIARSLARQGKKVILCEGGALDYSDESQEIYLGETIGDVYFDLDVARLRYFGGSTNHWHGICRSLEAIDFDRSYISEALKWPITKSDIDPYLDEACGILDIGSDFPEVEIGRRIRTVTFKESLPTRFAEKYLEEIQASDKIEMITNANFVDVEVIDRRISQAMFKSYNGKHLSVRAENVVLATGGIENSRLLLWLHRNHGDRLYDKRLPVGEYWMEHPEYFIGAAFVEKKVLNHASYSLDGFAQKEEGVLNCCISVYEAEATATERLLEDLLCVAPTYGGKMAELMEMDLACGAIIETVWELEPLKSNRIELSDSEKDKFGIPRPVLFWKKSPFDRRTLAVSTEVFNQWLHESDLGRLKLDEWMISDMPYPETYAPGGFHHMGGTRMGVNPEVSVVDSNCRIHGTKNFYVAGSSIFTTGGYTNPTLPIVQFSLRLADHLAKV
ncbi:GMC family oxidoreductase [uncultured Sneathiella sp.]|jgi:choline dehydrogenase-like flavoprotein|uniref:GMC family oxidoreductase n=1 Tax=uncultured Sneathiella sp. TaxID=879315 RepID=UPI0030DBD0CA|tara:strand:- start:775 stop:2190 length:1416 start_codon:yes stop_codon:yes gene_type:complete